jgi:hypothetical protein
MKLNLEIVVEIEGTASAGSAGSFNEPPSGPLCEIEHVWMVEGEKKLDIVDYLSLADLEIIIEAFLDEYGDLQLLDFFTFAANNEPESPHDTKEV